MFPHAACGSWLVSSDQGLCVVLEGTDIPCHAKYTLDRQTLVRPQPLRKTLRFGGCTRLNTFTRDSTTCTRAHAGTQTNTQVASRSTMCTPRWAMTDNLDQYRLRRFDVGRVIVVDSYGSFFSFDVFSIGIFATSAEKSIFGDVGCAGRCARCEGSRCDSTATKHHTRDRHHLVRDHHPYHIGVTGKRRQRHSRS